MNKEYFKNFQDRFNKEYEDIEQTIEKPNILLVGATGVGKSSLINLCFGEDIAKVGVGKPVTDKISAYSKIDIPIVLYDTAGYEIGEEKQRQFFEHVIDYAINQKEKQVNEQIHLVWYCIQASGHRITELDLYVISKLQAQNIPVAVILTKCDLVTEKELALLKSELNCNSLFSVTTSTVPEPKYLELKQMINWSVNVLPVGVKEAFIRAQQIDLNLKYEKAREIIIQHTAGNAFVGFIPIPFSDAPILIASQAGMLARILYIYDLQWLNSKLAVILKGVGVGELISEGGKLLVANLLKLIPGVGQIIGGIISATVAASFTAAFGFAVSEICYNIYGYVLENEESKIKEYLDNLNVEELIKKHYKKASNEK